MIDLLDKISEKSWNILAYFLGAGFVIICLSAGVIVVKSSSVSYSNGQTSLNINAAQKVKKASNDAEYANKILLQKIERLEQQINHSSTVPVEVVESINDLKPSALEADKSNEELRTVVKEAIAK